MKNMVMVRWLCLELDVILSNLVCITKKKEKKGDGRKAAHDAKKNFRYFCSDVRISELLLARI